MKAYILSVAGIILLSAVITLICPAGKMGKSIKGAARLLILFVMLSPFISATERLPEGEIAEDPAYLAACAGLLEAEDEQTLSAYIYETYALSASVNAERESSTPFSLKKITVRLDLSGINGESERIHMVTRVKEDLEKLYGPIEVS